jgi:hypothetical protein
VERQERRDVHDDDSKMIVLLVQPLKNIADKIAVEDGATEVGQGVGRSLHLTTVVAHREVTLDEVVECGVEVKHACFTVADELVLDRVPDLAHGDAVLLGDGLMLAGDHAKDPGKDDCLHAVPGRVIDGRGIRKDMVGESIALQGEQNLITLAGIAYRRRI